MSIYTQFGKIGRQAWSRNWFRSSVITALAAIGTIVENMIKVNEIRLPTTEEMSHVILIFVYAVIGSAGVSKVTNSQGQIMKKEPKVSDNQPDADQDTRI